MSTQKLYKKKQLIGSLVGLGVSVPLAAKIADKSIDADPTKNAKATDAEMTQNSLIIKTLLGIGIPLTVILGALFGASQIPASYDILPSSYFPMFQ